MAFSSDSQRLLVGESEGADVWDARSGALVQPLERIGGVDESDLTDVEWGTGDAFVIGVVSVLSGLDDAKTEPLGTGKPSTDLLTWLSDSHRLLRWDASTGRLTPKWIAGSPSDAGPQDRCGFSRLAGLLCLRVGRGLPLRIVDALRGTELTRLSTGLEHVQHSVMSNDGELLALADGSTVEVWETRSGRKRLNLSPGDEQYVTDVAFDDRGKRLITAGGEATPIARIWDAQSGLMLSELRGHTHGINEASFSPDGNLAVTASQDTTARVWRVSDGQPIATLRGHREIVMGAWFSPDSSRVLTASADGTARVSDVSLAGSGVSLRALADRRRTRELTDEERERFLP